MCAERYLKEREKRRWRRKRRRADGVVTKNRATVAHMPDTQ